MSLTEEQQGVVRCADGFNLVCALPGSGKTHTSISVAEKILELSDRYSVGMVTFTKASAMEMTQRVKDRIGGGISMPEDKVKCSTFHSFVLEQWRNYKPGFVLIIGTKQSNITTRNLKVVMKMPVRCLISMVSNFTRNPWLKTPRILGIYTEPMSKSL